MNDFLHTLAQKTLGKAAGVRPRLPSRFEPWLVDAIPLTTNVEVIQDDVDSETPSAPITQSSPPIVPDHFRPTTSLKPAPQKPLASPAVSLASPVVSRQAEPPFRAAPLRPAQDPDSTRLVSTSDTPVVSPSPSPLSPPPSSSLHPLEPAAEPKATLGSAVIRPALLDRSTRAQPGSAAPPGEERMQPPQPLLVPRTATHPMGHGEGGNRGAHHQPKGIPPTPSAAQPPRIQVSIGRIEVRMTPQNRSAAPVRPRQPQPSMDVEAYLQMRREERR